PCDNSLNGVTGHKINMKGAIDLPLRLGSIEIVRPFVVVSRLHVDAILGTDTLKVFRAVVDLDDSTLTLNTTNEVFQLGSPRVEEYHSSKMSATVRLQPGGQAIVVTELVGNVPEDTTSGKLVVEVCNASTEDVIIRKGTTVAVATLVPEAAFTYGDNNPSADASSQNQVSRSTREVISAASGVENDNFTWAPQTDNTLHDELEVDFNSSKLSLEQQKLLQDLLYQFKDIDRIGSSNYAAGSTLERSVLLLSQYQVWF
ncbi:putative membrane protein, partial [Phytophthora megakarya]